MKAFLDKNRCAADPRICRPLKECPQKAVSWVEDEDEPLGSRMEIDRELCSGCGICAELCCGHCISMQQA